MSTNALPWEEAAQVTRGGGGGQLPWEEASTVMRPSQSATAQQMATEGVENYQSGQGLPFGHYGAGMRTGDITPTQAASGAAAIGAATVAPAMSAAMPVVKALTSIGAKYGIKSLQSASGAYGIYRAGRDLFDELKQHF